MGQSLICHGLLSGHKLIMLFPHVKYTHPLQNLEKDSSSYFIGVKPRILSYK